MMRYIIILFLATYIVACYPLRENVTEHRIHYKQDFLTDERSPLKEEDLPYLDFYPAESAGRIKAKFALTPGEKPFELPTYSGITRAYRKYGVASFKYKGQNARLTLYENMTFGNNPLYKDYLFLPFKDETNGETTYGGGRYLNMSKADAADGKIVIDFNYAYNPWCAFSDGYNCPIPPKENHLPFAVTAGEKNYRKKVN